MILIADSGSTKTTWMEVKSGNKVVTEGMNPHFTTDEQFLAACSAVRQQLVLHSPLSTFMVPVVVPPPSRLVWPHYSPNRLEPAMYMCIPTC